MSSSIKFSDHYEANEYNIAQCLCVCVYVCELEIEFAFFGHSLGARNIYIQVLVIDPELWGTGLWGMGGGALYWLLLGYGIWGTGYGIWDTANGGGTGNGN